MIRTIFRDDRVLFGPLRDSDLAILSHEPEFAGFGLAAQATPGTVEVYATFPNEPQIAQKISKWMLKNHTLISV